MDVADDNDVLEEARLFAADSERGGVEHPRAPDGRLIAKQFDEIDAGGRLIDPETGEVEPFVTDAFVSLPAPRPSP